MFDAFASLMSLSQSPRTCPLVTPTYCTLALKKTDSERSGQVYQILGEDVLRSNCGQWHKGKGCQNGREKKVPRSGWDVFLWGFPIRSGKTVLASSDRMTIASIDVIKQTRPRARDRPKDKAAMKDKLHVHVLSARANPPQIRKGFCDTVPHPKRILRIFRIRCDCISKLIDLELALN